MIQHVTLILQQQMLEIVQHADAGYDCDNNCLADADGDGVCDEFEVVGCQDDTACNFDSSATDADRWFICRRRLRL